MICSTNQQLTSKKTLLMPDLEKRIELFLVHIWEVDGVIILCADQTHTPAIKIIKQSVTGHCTTMDGASQSLIFKLREFTK